MTLTEFLLSRIAEDEYYALYVTSGYAQHKRSWRNPSTGVVDVGDPDLNGLQPLGDGPLASHIARWDPERVLAECEAKRRITDRHHRSGVICPRCSLGTEDGEVVFERNPCETLRLLSLPYADHPDYRQEWRP